FFVFFFFFSSRRRHTRSYGDWSSDVCSSDLGGRRAYAHRGACRARGAAAGCRGLLAACGRPVAPRAALPAKARVPAIRCRSALRSEERRVGKEGRTRRAAEHRKEKGVKTTDR